MQIWNLHEGQCFCALTVFVRMCVIACTHANAIQQMFVGGLCVQSGLFLCIQVCACFACLCPCVLAPGLHLHLSRLISVTRPKEVLSFRGDTVITVREK